MGIKGLMNIIDDEAPGARKEHELKNYTGRKIAIDASMAMYQFLVAVRSAEQSGQAGAMLTNDAGEVTSHIQGLFNRTIRFMTAGVQPVYVFDGKPPKLKGGELAKRTKMRTEAQENLKKAEAADDAENVDKFSKRLVKITRQHNEDAKKLLRLMGVPVVEAPCEAEAQCAELAKGGTVYAAATEDMDTLTFATPHLVRKMNVAASRKEPLVQIDYDKILAGLELTKEEFVDLCILCGCDYCDRPAGIGPKTALKLIRKHGNLETIIRFIDTKKHPLPPGWFKPKDYDANAAQSDPRTADADKLAAAAAASDMSGPSEEGEGASSSSPAAAEEAAVAVEDVAVEMTPAEPKAKEAEAEAEEAAVVKPAVEEVAADGLVDTDDETEPIKDAAATDDAKPMEVVEVTPAAEEAAEKASPGAKAAPSTNTEAMDVVEVDEASADKASPAKASAGTSLTGKKKKQGDINSFFNAPNPKKQKQAGLGAFFGAQSKSSSAAKPAAKPAAAASKPAAASPAASASSSSSSASIATPAAAAEEPAPAMTSKKGAQNAHLSEPDEDGWQPIFVEVRRLFNFPEVTPAAEVELKWTDCDEVELLKFLVEDMGFSSDRVLPGIKRLKEAKKQSSQKRMDSFFKVMPGAAPKKKAPEPKGKGKGKGKGKAGGKFRR